MRPADFQCDSGNYPPWTDPVYAYVWPTSSPLGRATVFDYKSILLGVIGREVLSVWPIDAPRIELILRSVTSG